MINFYSAIQDNDSYHKIQVNDLLFVEYTCMVEDTRFGIWSNNNYFAFISSGKKLWRTIYHSYEADEGDILFIKKGANLAHQFFDSDFCAIFIFIPDEFIREFLKKNPALLDAPQKDLSDQDAVLRVQRDEVLDSYGQSIRSYLSFSQKPPEKLLILKFEELLLSLFTNKKHKALTDYFISLCQNPEYQLSRMMEENFAYNLRLENYAQLCHMSLSTFKKTFSRIYHRTPASWLKERRLDLALHKLLNTDLSISQISFECGFEDTSHFIRVFKQKHDLTPLQYRQKHRRATTTQAKPQGRFI